MLVKVLADYICMCSDMHLVLPSVVTTAVLLMYVAYHIIHSDSMLLIEHIYFIFNNLYLV